MPLSCCENDILLYVQSEEQIRARAWGYFVSATPTSKHSGPLGKVGRQDGPVDEAFSIIVIILIVISLLLLCIVTICSNV